MREKLLSRVLGFFSIVTLLMSSAVVNAQNAPSYDCTADLLAGQTTLVGEVSVSSDQHNLYVTYSTNGGWKMTETHLYVGACNSIPTSGNKNNPVPGQFPHKSNHNNATTVTYTIPLNSIDSCFCVAAHAVVKKGGQSETAWGDGIRFNNGGGNWATYFQCCGDGSPDPDPDPNPDPTPPVGSSYDCISDLLAGQTILVGEVSVSSDADSLYVNYTTNGGWKINETHLYVGVCGGAPTAGRSANPVPGQFPYKSNHNNVTSVTYAISLDDVDSCFCVAAHAVVKKGGQSETAWGDGTRFTQRGNWATYFECCGTPDTIIPPPPPPVVPDPGPCSPDSLISVNQALRWNGGSVMADRSNPYNAVGPPQQCAETDPVCYFSLGFGGTITLGWSANTAFFDQPGNDLFVNEVSYNSEGRPCSFYPEIVEVAVSQDDSTYYVIDTICRSAEVDIAVSGLPWIKYIRITDITDRNDFLNRNWTDGYDLNGIDCVPAANTNKRDGLDRTVMNYSFKVYPNPTSGSVTLKAEVALKHFEETKVEIYDVFGKLVYTTSYHGQVEQTIDISHFTPGMYMVHFNVNGVREVQKLMVQ